MEEISGFKNFAEYRKNAGIAAQQKSLRDIYHAFQQLTKCSDW